MPTYLYGGMYEGQFTTAPLFSLVNPITGQVWDAGAAVPAWSARPSTPKSHLVALVFVPSEEVFATPGTAGTKLGTVVFNVPTKLDMFALVQHDANGVRIGFPDLVVPQVANAGPTSSGFRGSIAIQIG